MIFYSNITKIEHLVNKGCWVWWWGLQEGEGGPGWKEVGFVSTDQSAGVAETDGWKHRNVSWTGQVGPVKHTHTKGRGGAKTIFFTAVLKVAFCWKSALK